jgi:hypothetical protein
MIERCLLLTSMPRALSTLEGDPRQFSPLGAKANYSPVANRAVQTFSVESCLYPARRGTQRAFATGPTGTASVVANYCAHCLRGVLVVYFLLNYAKDRLDSNEMNSNFDLYCVHPFGLFDTDSKAIECGRFGRRFGVDQFVQVQSNLGFETRRDQGVFVFVFVVASRIRI